MEKRIYVTKRDLFQTEGAQLKETLKTQLRIDADWIVRNGYDLSLKDETQLTALTEQILIDPVTDTFSDQLPQMRYTLATEYLPGQYDQRADSARQCLAIVADDEEALIRSFRIVQTDAELTQQQQEAVEAYLINPIETRKKNLDELKFTEDTRIDPVPVVEGFTEKDEQAILSYLQEEGYSMTVADMLSVRDYFRDTEHRDPTLTELRVLDTYWSDHCRHTTFETELTAIEVLDGPYKEELNEALEAYRAARKEIGRGEKPVTLMDMATLYAKVLRARGGLQDLEVSEEINAASIRIEVEKDGAREPWLLQFKNETHNHPTEIEPFGGASTCVGGAIRDPLSGRAYVYQAMRITGAADITAPLDQTLPGKLPQSKISKTAAQGNASYGNQIGLTASYVEELYHPGYVAKRMELGAVVGASPEDHVVRGTPAPGDVILLLGGPTGRDGVGGATGSSREHTEESLEKSSSEVQKGNAIEERKLQRLYRNRDAARMIKRSNDFGAGGVSVAIGEIADGVRIDLDAVPVKYSGLDGTELAISESQERMAVVIDAENEDAFRALCEEENLTATRVAVVQEEPRVQMRYRGQTVVDLARDFLNTAGVRASQTVTLAPETREFPGVSYPETKEAVLENLRLPQNASQQGMVEMFDSSIGRTTVLMPYGGRTQRTRQEAGVQKLPVPGGTDSASVLSYGFDPYLSEFEPFVGAQYSVIEALARQVAVGAPYRTARLSNQEYFERLGDVSEKWGKVVKALLGLYRAQAAFETPSIGGKDSMSGTFHDLDVPPTLVTFAVTVSEASATVSAELKEKGSKLLLLPHRPDALHLPDYAFLKRSWDAVLALRDNGLLLAAKTIQQQDVVTALIQMGLGNEIGCDVTVKDHKDACLPGSLLLEVKEEADVPEGFVEIGHTVDGPLRIDGIEIGFDEAQSALESRYADLYPLRLPSSASPLCDASPKEKKTAHARASLAKPRVVIPVFPGTNCEFDTYDAFVKAGAAPEVFVLRTQNQAAITESMRALAEKMEQSQIIVLSGGFSGADEPDGSGKYIVSVLNNPYVREGIEKMMDRDGLMLGICNGFQALIKSGLLPYGKVTAPDPSSPTLFRNEIGRHVSRMVDVSVVSATSPWMAGFAPGERFVLPVSHGEGRLMAPKEVLDQLFADGQVASVYVDPEGEPTVDPRYNPNGAYCGIEALTSPDGRILGRMAHSERYTENVFVNIPGRKSQDIFQNGVNWFK